MNFNKKIGSLILLAGIIVSTSCNFNEKTEQEQDILIENNTTHSNEEEINSPDDAPAPGEGTATSTDETPLDQQTATNYKGNDGSELSAIYSFDENNKGVVQIMRQGKPDLKLQQKGEAWASGADYSDGKIEWSASKNEATLKENNKTITYKAY